ncbi:hypothetical protein [Streptomyces spiramyceticus]|uniref:hypothetical protein n=1 Tax=Streptomyces spiramyceticus TaxID=299717 RepID=UPI003B75B65F
MTFRRPTRGTASALPLVDNDALCAHDENRSGQHRDHGGAVALAAGERQQPQPDGADRLWLSMFHSTAVPTSVPPSSSNSEDGARAAFVTGRTGPR